MRKSKSKRRRETSRRRKVSKERETEDGKESRTMFYIIFIPELSIKTIFCLKTVWKKADKA
jgi:hypothetical protein